MAKTTTSDTITTVTRTATWYTAERTQPQAISLPSRFDVSHSAGHGWLEWVRKEVYANPKVKALYFSIRENRPAIDYWIVIGTRDVALIKEIAIKQRARVLNLFAEQGSLFPLDFHICYQENRPLEEVVPTGAIPVPKF